MADEFEFWKAKCERLSNVGPRAASDLIKICSQETFPHVNFLFRLLLTLPTGIAEAERSFSTIKRLKNWLRSTMSQERLTSLALLHVHHNIDLDVEKVITRYAKTREHRSEFVL